METVKNTLGKAVQPVVQPIANKLDRSSGLVFVTAGQDVVGYRVASRLLKTGYEDVRVGYHDPLEEQHHDSFGQSDLDLAAIDDLDQAGATKVNFCWAKEETYEKALEGVKTAFCCPPNQEGWEERFPAFLKACKHAGVRRVVKLSFYHALASDSESMSGFALATRSKDIFKTVPLVRMHGYCDKKLMKSGLDYTILFPTHFMSNPLRYQGKILRTENKFYGASGLKGVNYVSPNDVADVAVRTILAPKDHHKVGYTLTGPKAITDMEVADHLSKAFNTTIEYVNQAAKEFTDTDMAALEIIKASGVEELTEFVSKDIEKVCDRKAETYEEYLLNKESMLPKEQAAFLPA